MDRDPLEAGAVMTAGTIASAVLVALGWTIPAWVAPAIERATRELGADAPLVLAVCAQESALGRTRAPLCGAISRAVGTDAVSQAFAAARAFPARAGVRRWRARLVTWRCGWDRQCAAVVGAGYAARVLALRARIARAGGVP